MSTLIKLCIAAIAVVTIEIMGDIYIGYGVHITLHENYGGVFSSSVNIVSTDRWTDYSIIKKTILCGMAIFYTIFGLNYGVGPF